MNRRAFFKTIIALPVAMFMRRGGWCFDEGYTFDSGLTLDTATSRFYLPLAGGL